MPEVINAKPAPSLEGGLLKEAEFAAMLRTSVSTLRRMRRKGDLPSHIVVSKSLRWRAADVSAFVDGSWRPEPKK
jgi:predicted DNA-binding transcriptional regulator AlpA